MKISSQGARYMPEQFGINMIHWKDSKCARCGSVATGRLWPLARCIEPILKAETWLAFGGDKRKISTIDERKKKWNWIIVFLGRKTRKLNQAWDRPWILNSSNALSLTLSSKNIVTLIAVAIHFHVFVQKLRFHWRTTAGYWWEESTFNWRCWVEILSSNWLKRIVL